MTNGLLSEGRPLGARDSLISRLVKDARPRKEESREKKNIQTQLTCIIKDRHLFIYIARLWVHVLSAPLLGHNTKGATYTISQCRWCGSVTGACN